MRFTISIETPGADRSEATFEDRVTVGRDGTEVLLADPSVSRRHVELLSGSDGQLTVTDLGSSHGTFLNGNRLAVGGAAPLRVGDRLFLGDSTITILAIEGPEQDAPITGSGARSTVGPGGRPQPAELVMVTTSAGFVRHLPTGAPAKAARAVAAALPKARRRLDALAKVVPGSAEARPTICLVGPFPDPGSPDRWITDGVVVDGPGQQLWMVVTDDSPPEALERPLALLLGARLPAADELADLLEGYGSWVAAGPARATIDERLAAEALPTLGEAEGEQRGAMLTSFVGFLIEREGEAAFCSMLAATQPNRLEASLRAAFGVGAAELEELWRRKLATGSDGKPVVGTFAKVALRYLRPYRRRQVEIFGYMLAGLAFTLTLPFITRRLIDVALPTGKMSEVFKLLVVLAVAFAVSIAASLRRTYVSAYISSAVVRDLRGQLFERLQRLPAGWYQQHQQGDVLSRLFNDVGLVERGLSQVLREGIFEGLSVVVSAGILLTLNPLLGAVGILGIPAIAIIYRSLARTAERRSTAVQEETSSQLTIAAENYDAERVVKVFGLGTREIARFATAAGRLFRAERRLSLLIGMFSLSVNTVVIAIRLVIMALGAYLVTRGSLSIGGLVAFLGVLGEMIQPVLAVTNVGQELQSASGALVRVQELLDEPLEAEGVELATESLPRLAREIRFEGVGFGYDASRKVLDGVDVTIPFGAKVAFVGPSGSGKSTILGLLMRMYDPDEGRILFDGVDIARAPLDALRSQLGVVLQESFLFDTSIRENISLGLGGDAGQAEIEAAARAAEAHDFITASPRGYDTLVGERGSRLSGGQRQRLAVARALVRNPAVLLLDEATSALDPATERQINGTLSRAGSGRTTVAITHRLTSVVDYDLIYVIAAGRVVESGNHAELVAAGGVYAGLWAEQTGDGAVTAAAAGSAAPGGDGRAAGVDLDRLPFVAELSAGEREALLAASTPLELAPGDLLYEEVGHIVFVRAGRAEVLPGGVASLVGGAGAPAPVAELGPGDVFGMRAAYGQPGGSSLRALTACSLLIVAVPALRAGDGRGAEAVGPRTGRHLTRSTMILRPGEAPAVGAAAAEVRRATRRLTGIGR